MTLFGIHDLWLFVLAGLLLNITPGPDTLYIVGRSTTQGFRAGVLAALGIAGGCFVHITAAAIGLSALLAASAAAFAVLKFIGAAYLVYVGITLLREPGNAKPNTSGIPAAPLKRIFWQGFLTNALNPKVALFFLAFLPQFIDTSSPGKTAAFLLLGLIFNVNGTLWNIFVAWATVSFKRVFSSGSSAGLWINRSIGAIFIGLGIKLALSERGP
jgi:threonine/homoserine/homoserine lactone efflux protein